MSDDKEELLAVLSDSEMCQLRAEFCHWLRGTLLSEPAHTFVPVATTTPAEARHEQS